MDRGVALSAQRHQISQVFIENAGVCLVMDVGSAALITALTYIVVPLKYVLSALLPERCAEIPMIGRAGIEGAHTVHFQKRAVDRCRLVLRFYTSRVGFRNSSCPRPLRVAGHGMEPVILRGVPAFPFHIAEANLSSVPPNLSLEGICAPSITPNRILCLTASKSEQWGQIRRPPLRTALARFAGPVTFPAMPKRKYERGAAAFVPAERRVSADDAKARLTERDRRQASDTRTEAQRWLNDPPPDRSALAARNPRR
jgi:hypothetical protein